MYITNAYLGLKHEDIVSTASPLLITAVGHYRVYSKARVKTTRQNGRGDYQLIYVAEGKMLLVLNGKEQILQKGNMVLFRPGEQQNYTLYAKDKPETYWVHFTGNNVNRILEYYNIQSGENVFFTGASANYAWIFNQMINELKLKRTDFSDMLTLQLRQLFLFIHRNRQEELNMSPTIFDEVENAVQYFNKNYYLPIEIEDYAKEHHITTSYLIRNFKKIVHVSPMQYIVSLRIESAQKQLDSTDSSIAQIAESVGYDDPQYFSRLFSRHVGISPREYRKRKEQKP